jgi:hypothetical protein
METALLITLALLPLGFVAAGAVLLIKRKLRKKPELKLVEQPLQQAVVEKAATLAAKTQGAPSNLKKAKKKSRRGKRK